MTRISVSRPAPDIPVTVAFAELAIAAGRTGRSIVLCYRDYPSPLVCELWSRHCRSLSGDQVYHVRTAADARKLEAQVGDVRVVLVHDARHHNAVSWIIQLHATHEGQSRPAVFTSTAAKDLDENPGATLVLGCNANESRAIEAHLFRSEPVAVDWSNAHPSHDVEIDDRLQPVWRQNLTADEVGACCFRDHLILQGLLAGACVLRRARTMGESACAGRIGRGKRYSVMNQSTAGLTDMPMGCPAERANRTTLCARSCAQISAVGP